MTYASEVLADSPLAYYRLGEASGTTMGDSSGNGRDGAYNNPPVLGAAGLLVGDSNTAADFNGSDDYANVVGGAWVDVTTVSIEAWAKRDGTPPSQYVIVNRDDGNFTGSNMRHWSLAINSANKATFAFWASDGGATQVVTSTTTLSDGVAYHLVGTYDGSVGRLYVNGVQEATVTIAGAIQISATTADVRIGRSASSSTLFFNGIIDEIAIYSGALSATRILAHYNAGTTAPSTLLRPAAIVEIAFNAGYSTPAASRVWTDVTQYVRIVDGIDITHGRQDEQGQADANSCRLVLNNSDGRFTPGLATSPYYPNVRIGRPLRITSTPTDGSASTRFVGYIDEWPVEWPAVVDTFATSAISATSRIARLGTSAPLGNHIYEEIKRDSPLVHYMLDTRADSVSGGTSLVQAGSGTAVAFEGTGPTDGIQAAQFAAGKYLTAPINLGTPTALWVSVFYQLPAAADPTFVALTSGDSLSMQLYLVDSQSSLYVSVSNAQGINNTPAGTFDDNTLRHAAAVMDGTNVDLYHDGTADLQVDAHPLPTGAQVLKIGSSEWSPTFDATMTGVIAHVAIGTAPITGARLQAHNTAGKTGFSGETAEDRLKRYAAFAGIPTAELSISAAADTPIAHIDTTGQTALSLMRRVAETDGGVLYDARDGTLTYVARSARYNAATVITLDASAGQVAASYAPKLDRSALINEVVATIADGSDPQETVTARDQSSYDDYGPHRGDIELATTSADEAHAAAWWRVNTYAEPRARAPQLDVELARMSTALQGTMLGLDVSSKVTVSNLPSQSDASSKSFFIEGFSERIGPETHELTFNISPTTGFDVFTIEDNPKGTIGDHAAAIYPLAY